MKVAASMEMVKFKQGHVLRCFRGANKQKIRHGYLSVIKEFIKWKGVMCNSVNFLIVLQPFILMDSSNRWDTICLG